MNEPELGGDASFGITSRRPALKEQIDAALDRIKRNGTYDRINSRFLPFESTNAHFNHFPAAFPEFSHLAQARELQVAVGSHHEWATQPAVGGKRSALAAFNEDLAREICRRISARCTVVFMTFGEILPGIEANKVALGFGNFLRTPAREKGVAFSDSIWRSSSRLVTTRAAAQRFATEKGTETRLDSLRQARVVGVPETQQYAYLQRLSSANGLTLIDAKTYRDAFSLLREGQADFSCCRP